MFFRLLLLFILVPMLDFALLLRVAQAIHWGPTIALCICTGLLGAALARWQGFRTLQAIQTDLAQGRMPGDRLADGALILFAGATLFFPGFATDALGFFLLIPPCRQWVRRYLTKYFAAHVRIITPSDFTGGPAVDIDGGPHGRPMKYVRNVAASDSIPPKDAAGGDGSAMP